MWERRFRRFAPSCVSNDKLQDQEKVLLRDREKFLHIIDGDKRLIASDTNKKEVLQARQKEMGAW